MQFQPNLLQDSYSLFEDPALLEAARKAAKESVVSWRFATGDMSIAEPFRKELYGDHAKWKKENAKPGKRDLRHGFDESQRLRLVETQEGEHICHLDYEGAHFKRFGHSPPIPNNCVRQFEFDEQSRVVRQHILYAGHGCQREYTWKDGILTTVEIVYWSQDWKNHAVQWNEIKIGIQNRIRQDYVYDNQGLFQIIDRCLKSDGNIDLDTSGEVQYLRIPEGMTAPSISNEITNIIVRETPVLVGKAASKDATYYALMICYCSEDPVAGWPPFLLLANESILSSKNRFGSELKYIAWAPDELREMKENVEIQFSDPKLVEI